LKHLTQTAQALPRSDALRQEAWRWLQEQRIVRPGRTTLRDLLTAAREGALQQAFALLASELTAEQREQLDALLLVPSGGDAEREAGVVTEFWSRSGLEQYKTLARKESPEKLSGNAQASLRTIRWIMAILIQASLVRGLIS
jgi:hypothetical protein